MSSGLRKAAEDFEAHVKTATVGKLIGPEFDDRQMWWTYRLSVGAQTPVDRFTSDVQKGAQEMEQHRQRWVKLLAKEGFPRVRDGKTWVTPSEHGLELSTGIEYHLSPEQYDRLLEMAGEK